MRLDSGETLPNEELTYRPYKARSYAYLSDTAFSAKAAGLAAAMHARDGAAPDIAALQKSLVQAGVVLHKTP